jgi:hypothetical protein
MISTIAYYIGTFLVLTHGLSQDPSHFKIIPLNFFTIDSRNDIFFNDSNYYGVRIAWIASDPPSNNIVINNSKECIIKQWNNTGYFNPHKNKWSSQSWKYSFADLRLFSGQTNITIGTWTYMVNIPKFGVHNYDDTTILIGDPNLGDASRYALGSADIVIKTVLKRSMLKANLVLWLGDIFYHDNENSITREFPKLTEVHNNVVIGIPSYLQVGIQGNHDYSSNTGCHECNWYIKKDNLSCTSNLDVSASWVNYLFVSDGIKSFHDGLSENYHRGCKVPYEYTLQIKVLARTGYIIIDNTWNYNDIKINWSDVYNKLNNHIDTLLVCGHWDLYGYGATSVVRDWIKYLSGYFPNKKIFGIQGHTHENSYHITSNNNKLITIGGNGFKGSGCDCTHGCFGCHCCCPSLFANDSFILGGWDSDKLCSPNLSW